MNLHEYQAKEVLRTFGLNIPPFAVCSTVGEAESFCKEHALEEVVVKIQVHAGGRGKAGGVKLAKGLEEIKRVTKELLGMKMVNQQTGPEGVVAHKVLVAAAASIAKEFYLGIVVDREKKCPMMIASPEGGTEIEELAEKSPEKILTLPINLDGKIPSYRLQRLCGFMGWQGALAKEGAKIAQDLAKAFISCDGSLLEVNPLIETSDGHLEVLDAKFAIDDNALFRQKNLSPYFDPTQVSAREVEAREHDLAYIALDGEIGCMVNGAGLAMATMDIIKSFGGAPANFLDVGGSATKEKVAAGFRIILQDPQVKGVFVNIFGGIMNCGTIAEGLVAAVEELGISVPLVVRLEGTDVDRGRKILKESLDVVQAAHSMDEGAEKIVAAVKGS